MNSRKNFTMDIQAEVKQHRRLRTILGILLAVTLLFGMLLTAVAYSFDLPAIYLLASAQGVVAMLVAGKMSEYSNVIKENEAKL